MSHELDGLESLDDLVQLLREASPPPELLEEAKEATLERAAPRPGPTGPATLTHLGVAAIALGLAVAVHPGPGARVLPKAFEPGLGDAAAAWVDEGTPPDEGRSARAQEAARAGPEARAGGGAATAPAVAATRSPERGAERAAASGGGRKPGGAIARPSAPGLPFDLDLAPVPVVEAGPSAPSAEMADALRDYAAERYRPAATKLQEIVEGRTDDAPDRVAQAEFFLAKCLFHLGLYHAAAAAFDEVTSRGAEHPWFDESLLWLAMLPEHLPQPRGVIASVGRYDAAQLEALDRDGSRARYHTLLYLLGRARYDERRFDEAIGLLRRVPDDTTHALEARFFEGVSHVRLRHARPALVSFRRVIDAIEAGRTGDHDEPERMRDLAWMSVARLEYSLAMQTRDEERASEQLSAAIAAWRRIPMGSEQWLDSFFEETWALYMADRHARALGHVHALESPYLRERADPEAIVLRAMILFEHCQWDAVEHDVRRFHERYDPMLAAAERAQRMADTHENAFRMLVAVRRGRSRVPRAIVPALRDAYGDRELSRQLAQVRSIDAESDRLDAMGSDFAGASVGTRVSADLAIQRALEVDRAGELARARTRRLAEELRERMRQMDTVELELATARRAELSRPNPLPMGPPEGGRVYAVQGDQLWPWDGEWWPDEIPFYFQEIESRCR